MLTFHRLKPELWGPIANELGIPWRACEAMHWALGENDMARRASTTPFQIKATAHSGTEIGEPGSGRVAQRDRMLESTRVYEGRDLRGLGGSFCSVNGNGSGVGGGYHGGVSIPPIKDEMGSYFSPEGMEEVDEEEEEEGDGGRLRRRAGTGETRLPGFAELNGEIEAFAERGRPVRVKVESQDEGESG